MVPSDRFRELPVTFYTKIEQWPGNKQPFQVFIRLRACFPSVLIPKKGRLGKRTRISEIHIIYFHFVVMANR